MSFAVMVAISRSESLAARTRLCAAREIPADIHPGFWVDRHIDRLATTPAWVKAWAAAVAKGTEDPGADESVISDAMLLSGVKAMLAADSAAQQAKDQAAAEKADAEKRESDAAQDVRLAREAAREDRREARRLRLMHLAQNDPAALARLADADPVAVPDVPVVKPGKRGK